jgi:hypothetical protein
MSYTVVNPGLVNGNESNVSAMSASSAYFVGWDFSGSNNGLQALLWSPTGAATVLQSIGLQSEAWAISTSDERCWRVT